MTRDEIENEIMSNFWKGAGVLITASALVWGAMFWATGAQSKDLIAASEERTDKVVDGVSKELSSLEKQISIYITGKDKDDERQNDILEKLAEGVEQQQKIIRELANHDRDKSRDISDIKKDVSETNTKVHGVSTQVGQLKTQVQKLINELKANN